jgi:hypothetical protein
MTSARRAATAFLASLLLLAAIPALAAAAGSLQAETTPLAFPDTGIHDPSTVQNTKITNVGDENATIESVSVALPFSVDGGASECDDNPVLAPGASCNLVVRFGPLIVGPAAATVVVQYNDSEAAQALEIGVSGSGATGTIAASSPSFSPQPFYFGGQQQQVNVSNPTPFTVIAESATIAGPDAGAFNINFSACNGNFLAPGNNCGLDIQFNPTAAGSYVAELLIANSGTVDPLVVPLVATALSGPKAVINPGNVEFGTVKVGSAAASEQVSITNEGDFPLQIQQLLIMSGTPQSFPVSNDQCSQKEVNPGDSCEITVGFAPTKAGERNASVFVISNTPGPVTTSALTGEGMLAPAGSVALSSQAQVGAPIICLTSGYRDADELSYRWLRGASAIPGETQLVYVPGDADVGSTISCEVSALNLVGAQIVTSLPSAPVSAAAAGPQGPAGASGPQGARGGTGEAGAPGPAGARGSKGAEGKPGKREPKGKPGSSKTSSCKQHHRRAKAKRACGPKRSATVHSGTH